MLINRDYMTIMRAGKRAMPIMSRGTFVSQQTAGQIVCACIGMGIMIIAIAAICSAWTCGQ